MFFVFSNNSKWIWVDEIQEKDIYAALLKCGDYKEYIIKDIEEKYKYMLASGATTFWETQKAEADFDNAGSLCHGWSTMPIYYFNKLLQPRKEENLPPKGIMS